MNNYENGKNLTLVESELRPPELTKFGDYDITRQDIREIAGIAGPVVEQLARVFSVEKPKEGWTVEALGELIAKVGPAKALQENIPQVQEILQGANGQELAAQWVEESGLLDSTFRNFEDPNMPVPSRFESTVITGGVRNWMVRRATLLIEMSENITVDKVTLVAGTRPMKEAEGPDVIEGDSEASFMERVIVPLLTDAGLQVKLVTPDTANGQEIARTVAEETEGSSSVLVVCNAGNWPQNGGQIRRAIGGSENKVFVASDSFPLAYSGEPAATHQNPLTAVGIIARNLQELQRHADKKSL